MWVAVWGSLKDVTCPDSFGVSSDGWLFEVSGSVPPCPPFGLPVTSSPHIETFEPIRQNKHPKNSSSKQANKIPTKTEQIPTNQRDGVLILQYSNCCLQISVTISWDINRIKKNPFNISAKITITWQANCKFCTHVCSFFIWNKLLIRCSAILYAFLREKGVPWGSH